MFLGQCSDWLHSGQPGYDPRRGAEDFFLQPWDLGRFWGPPSLNIQWVPGRDAEHTPPPSAEIKND